MAIVVVAGAARQVAVLSGELERVGKVLQGTDQAGTTGRLPGCVEVGKPRIRVGNGALSRGTAFGMRFDDVPAPIGPVDAFWEGALVDVPGDIRVEFALPAASYQISSLLCSSAAFWASPNAALSASRVVQIPPLPSYL